MPSIVPGEVDQPGTSQQVAPWPDLGLNTLDTAIVHTVAYADVFDYPLTPEELHRYLIRVPASLIAVRAALQTSLPLRRYLSHPEGLVTVRGHEALVETRRRRSVVAASMWPRVEHYASAIARLPFVRMVALSGALSVGNSDEGADIDYFIVTEPGHLWSCRAAIIALVRLAARSGVAICPNYLLSKRALALQERSLYTAHEFLQLAPLVGVEMYRQMWQLNAWTAEFLPNAYEQARTLSAHSLSPHPLRSVLEAALRTPLGTRLEEWEMARKVARFGRNAAVDSAAAFTADRCKGHLMDHGARTLAALTARLQELAQT